MTRETVCAVVKQAIETDPRRVTFIWHGGEPLLLPRSFYLAALEAQRDLARQDQMIQNNIQTNGLLLDEKWLEFLTANRFHIGISMDALSWLHDSNRATPAGHSSYADVRGTLTRLMEHRVNFGLLTVVTPEALALGAEMFDALVGLGVKQFDFLPCVDLDPQTGTVGPLHVNPADFGKFLIDVLHRWFEVDDPDIKVRFLDNILCGALGGEATLCKLSGDCASFLTVMPDGDLYPCDSFMGVEEYRLGNLASESLVQVLHGNRLRAFGAEFGRMDACVQCSANFVCKGGCFYQHYLAQRCGSDYCSMTRSVVEEMVPMIQLAKDAMDRGQSQCA